MKLSQWHDGNVKPVHIGLYSVRSPDLGGNVEWDFWYGENWGQQWALKINAIKCAPCEYHARFQDKQWRGIVKDKK